jgi:GNAT superfamily N-acetyltransferase
VRRDAGLVAVRDGRVIGFLTVERHFAASVEIGWMAVEAARRRRGVGGRPIDRLCADLAAEGCRVLLVLTASDDDRARPDGYWRTREFYRGRGFVDARDLPGFWESNTALLLVRPL